MKIQIPPKFIISFCDDCGTNHAPIRDCPPPEVMEEIARITSAITKREEIRKDSETRMCGLDPHPEWQQ